MRRFESWSESVSCDCSIHESCAGPRDELVTRLVPGWKGTPYPLLDDLPRCPRPRAATPLNWHESAHRNGSFQEKARLIVPVSVASLMECG